MTYKRNSTGADPGCYKGGQHNYKNYFIKVMSINRCIYDNFLLNEQNYMYILYNYVWIQTKKSAWMTL